MNVHILNRIDPLRKQAERDPHDGKGLSPMDPPDAYAPPRLDPVPVQALHPFLRRFSEEHAPFLQELNAFEESILAIQESGYTRESDAGLRRFFNYFDQVFGAQSRREEANLFPLLRERLIASGEHGSGSDPTTATDAMADEHAKAMQLAAVVVNFLGLVFRLPDERSGMIVLDAAIEQCKTLLELLRLHVFREDNVIIPLAHRLISGTELDRMHSGTAAAGT